MHVLLPSDRAGYVESCSQLQARAQAGSTKSVRALGCHIDHMVLTVIIPVYNEGATVAHVLDRVLAAPYPKQVIVVNDGSTDDTDHALMPWQSHPDVELLHHARNRGKGAAIRTALARARGRFTLIRDADLEYDLGDYPRQIEPLLCGEAQGVYGSHYLGRGPGRHSWRLHRYGVAALNFCIQFLCGARLTDEATCYKGWPTSLLRAMELRCQRFEFCLEVTAKACRLGLTIHEVPIHYAARTVKAGKKIGWKDGLEALAALWKWRHWQPKLLPRQATRLASRVIGPKRPQQ